ncbi:FIG074102: hypothetical protein [plant metagenome]|uniref:Cytoplasmic protein n=2 Tax=plant metagenome TaxID=1297885 RepID=A0A484Y8Y3_9ZZZZ
MGLARVDAAPMTPALSLPQARRIALAAQGFAQARPAGGLDARHLKRVLSQVALHQLDSVNVVARAHYLPLFSRLGPYPLSLLEEAAWGRKRKLFEYWAHEASLLPLETQPLLRWRMARADAGRDLYRQLAGFAHAHRPEAMAILKRIADEGPLAASALDAPRGPGGWWGWSRGKQALEWLFWAGHVTTATRRNSFERVYDLPERVLPAQVLALPTPDETEAHRALLRQAARSLGVATASDLRDYFRLPAPETKARLAELVEDGSLQAVKVEGWPQTAYLDPAARLPRRIEGNALLAPFDPLIWERDRVKRLFGMHYRIEIYVPAARRTHGYYVLPFLMDGALRARVDLKADRPRGTLLVQGAHAEPEAPAETAGRLAEELRAMAAWLGLESVAVQPRGDFAKPLAAALRSATR